MSEIPVPDTEEATGVFVEHRELLFGVVYNMLGSVTDTEDVLQDTWLSWSRRGAGGIDNPRAYLVRIAVNHALQRRAVVNRSRETYVGPWLPEPLVTDTAPDPGEAAEVAEQVSLALLVVLETLSPLERAVFVLREVFGLPIAEVATAVDRSEAAVRQLAHRAREHVQARQPRFDPDRRTQEQVTERFFNAVAGGDIDALMAVLSPGVVLVSDGGGVANAARRPIEGADKVARFLLGIAAKGFAIPGLEVRIADVNGEPGFAAWVDGTPFMAVSPVVGDDRIEQVLVVVNPSKLVGLGPSAPPG
jgi:RNA polymerase sigma factor (sigma-70 family)